METHRIKQEKARGACLGPLGAHARMYARTPARAQLGARTRPPERLDNKSATLEGANTPPASPLPGSRVVYVGRYIAEVVEALGAGRLVVRFKAPHDAVAVEHVADVGEWRRM